MSIKTCWHSRTGVVLAAVLALALTSCEQETAPEKGPRLVKAMVIAEPSSIRSAVFPGRAEAGQEVNLSFRVAGPLVEFPVSVGDQVEAGSIVARIDPTDYQSTVASLEGQLQSAQAAANRADADLGRLEKTFAEDPGATTEMALDRARQLRDSTASTARGLQATVKGARDQLSYTRLKAPFGGQVVETYVENFETVIPKQPILRIVDPTRIEFTISVAENQIVYAPYVTGAKIVFDALPGVEINAAIKEIGKEATQATRTYPVTLVMDQPDNVEVLAGMAGEAIIEAELPDAAGFTGISIPTTAMFAGSDSTKSFVWIINPEDSRLLRREIQTGGITDFGILVSSGLAAGEQIVIAGATLLSEGELVKPLGDAGESAAQ
jgi:RND family efflux transporter MFP subunit